MIFFINLYNLITANYQEHIEVLCLAAPEEESNDASCK